MIPWVLLGVIPKHLVRIRLLHMAQFLNKIIIYVKLLFSVYVKILLNGTPCLLFVKSGGNFKQNK